MTPEEVLAKLETMGIKTSRSTLLRFEQDGLVPKPKRGSGGRAQGRFSEYPEETPHFFFAAWMLIKSKKYTKEEIIKGILMSKLVASRILFSENPKRKIFSEETHRIVVERMRFIWRFFEADNSLPEMAMSPDETYQYFIEQGIDLEKIDHDSRIDEISEQWKEYALFSRAKIVDFAKPHINEFYYRQQIAELIAENKRLIELLKKHGINPA